MNNNTTTYTCSITRPHAVEVVTNSNGTISNVTQNIYYSPFNKVDSIKENNYKLTYTYGSDQQRRKSILTTNDLPLTTIYYAGGYEEITVGSDVYKVHYISSPAGLIAINVRTNGGADQLYYVYTDHLGSILTLVNATTGLVAYKQNFDAWGRERHADTWEYPTPTNPLPAKPEWLIRGFTGHEHLPEFALINMNGRCYDPVLGRMLSPDNYVQDATGTQAFNRYSYALNNPLVYTDPDGDFIVAATVYFLFFTETGYDVQNYVSPVSLNVDISLGTHQRGIGINTSVGVPQIAPVSYRVHGGASYYWKNYDVTPGWETRHGAEWGVGGFATVGSTHYNSPGTEFDQTTAQVRLGVPGLNIKYENDYFWDKKIPLAPTPDGGDRHRTAALKVQSGPLSAGFNLFTGDPGLDGDDRETDFINGSRTYITNRNGDDPDKYRAGVGYIGIGPFRIGNDTEKRRDRIQNQLVHNRTGSPHFKVLDRPNKFYFQFGTGGGSLW